MTTLQIVSDTHLEFRNNEFPVINRHASNLALLGDIGKPFTADTTCSPETIRSV